MPQQHCLVGDSSLANTGDLPSNCSEDSDSRRTRRAPKSKSKAINLVLSNITRIDRLTSSAKGGGENRKTTGKGDNRTAVGGKNGSNDSQQEVSAIPDPVPDSEDPAPAPAVPAPVHTSPLFQSGALPSSTTAPSKTNANLRPQTETLQLFTPLPAYYSLAASTSSRDAARTSPVSTTVSAHTSSSPITTKSISNVEQSNPNQPTSHHIPTAVVVLLVLGGTCLLGAILVVMKIRSRPKKRWHPTPSLPILQDSFPDEKLREDSPIFGGKERFSSRPGSNAVPWTWTQYHSGIPKPAAASQGTNTGPAYRAANSNTSAQRRSSRAGDDLRSGQDVKIEHATVATYAQPIQQHVQQHPATRITSRLSTVSLYPASIHPQASENIGIALSSGNTGAASDDNTGKGFAQDRSKRWSSRRSTRDLDRRRTTLYEATEIGYADAETTAPSPPAVSQGRERIKAPYGAGSYLRTSTSTSMIKHVSTETNPFEEPAYTVPPMPYLPTEERRDRNTKALTSALGLASPPPPSPEATLYPDDSLSIAGDKRHVGPLKKHGGHKVGSPGTEASAALGHLMLSDYRASKHIAVTSPDNQASASAGAMSPRVRVRADDKPPRVPSPPPMPSLAQMAMAHTNAADFADYRSPTYSIYGLYDPDRKSRVDSGY